MPRQDAVFRVAVVALLTVIAVQLGAWDSLTTHWHALADAVTDIGAAKEEAAPGSGGLGYLYQKDTDEAIRAMSPPPPASK